MDKKDYINLFLSTSLIALLSVILLSAFFIVKDKDVQRQTKINEIGVVIEKIKSGELVVTKNQIIDFLKFDQKGSQSMTQMLLSAKQFSISIGSLLAIVVFIQFNVLIKSRKKFKKS